MKTMNTENDTYTGIPHKRYTMQSWSERLKTIKDDHIRAWAASILYWDFDTEIAWEFFRPHTQLYSAARELKERTETIVAALTSIGYVKAEERCFNRQDEEREVMHKAGRTRGDFRGDTRFTVINA